MNGILLDKPAAKYLKLAEELLNNANTARPENSSIRPKVVEAINANDEVEQYHAYMHRLEMLHHNLYSLRSDPRFHLNDSHDDHVTSLLKQREAFLTSEIKNFEKLRKEQSQKSRATILALEAKLKSLA
eukprot:NODE_883_length_3472_cov_0.125704.p3 type:complete len:129 gc:universal NODE_883_length_3472_cov_0.125704:1780-1394(-)